MGCRHFAVDLKGCCYKIAISTSHRHLLWHRHLRQQVSHGGIRHDQCHQPRHGHWYALYSSPAAAYSRHWKCQRLRHMTFFTGSSSLPAPTSSSPPITAAFSPIQLVASFHYTQIVTVATPLILSSPLPGPQHLRVIWSLSPSPGFPRHHRHRDHHQRGHADRLRHH